MNREELSELVAGKMIEREIAPTSVNASDCLPPFRDIVKIIQAGKDWDINILVEKCGYFAVDRAVLASQSIDGLPADWPAMLRQSAIRDEVGDWCKESFKRLKRGDPIDPSQMIQQAYKLNGMATTIMSANELSPEIDPWIPSHWEPLDLYVGGLPKAGLTIIGAPPGTGKTSLLLKLAMESAKQGEKVMLFSMEMTGGQLVGRMRQMQTLAKKYQENILVCDEILAPADVASISTMVPDRLHFIGVDFAELMLVGGSDRTEGIMADVYTTLVRTAKALNTPVVLLSQLNRQYEGGLPQINHLRYTGMAEALASLVLLIYNKQAIFVRQDSGGSLPTVKDKAYIIVGKSRYGFNIKGKGGRFAIQVDWKGAEGWGNHGQVFAL